MSDSNKESKKALFPFTKKEVKLLTDPLNDNNPITVQVLGVCSALAVTSMLTWCLFCACGYVYVITLNRYDCGGSICCCIFQPCGFFD